MRGNSLQAFHSRDWHGSMSKALHMPIFTKPLMLETTSLIDSQNNSLSKGFSFNMLKCQKTNSSIHLSQELSMFRFCWNFQNASNWGILRQHEPIGLAWHCLPSDSFKTCSTQPIKYEVLPWQATEKTIFAINGNLVGGFNPSEKYARQNGFIFPNFRGEHKKLFETTTLWNISVGTRSTPGFFVPKKNSCLHTENAGITDLATRVVLVWSWRTWLAFTGDNCCVYGNTICIYNMRRQRATTKQLYCVLNIGKHCIVT